MWKIAVAAVFCTNGLNGSELSKCALGSEHKVTAYFNIAYRQFKIVDVS